MGKHKYKNRKEWYLDYYSKNKEKVLEYQREYHKKHPGKKREYALQYYQLHKDDPGKKEKHKEYWKKYYEKNNEEIIRKQCENQAISGNTFIKENPDRWREYQKEYTKKRYHENPMPSQQREVGKARAKEYYQKNKEKILAKYHALKNNKKENDN